MRCWCTNRWGAWHIMAPPPHGRCRCIRDARSWHGCRAVCSTINSLTMHGGISHELQIPFMWTS